MYKLLVIDNLSTGKRENINSAAYFWEQDLVTAEIETISEYLKDVDAVFHFAAMARVQPSIEDPVLRLTNIMLQLHFKIT